MELDKLISNFPASYSLVKKHIGHLSAKRSGLSYMKHVDDGILILSSYEASEEVLEAFALHPLLQADNEFLANNKAVKETASPDAYYLACEYRGLANSFLSPAIPESGPDESMITLHSDDRVNLMLVADKIQNYADFLNFQEHKQDHKLHGYFKTWLSKLKVTENQFYKTLVELEESSPWKVVAKTRAPVKSPDGTVAWTDHAEACYKSNQSAYEACFTYAELTDLLQRSPRSFNKHDYHWQ